MLRLPRPLAQLSLSQLAHSRAPICGPSLLRPSAFPSRTAQLRPFSSTLSALTQLPPSSTPTPPTAVTEAVNGGNEVSEKRVYPVPAWAERLPKSLRWTHPYLSLARMDKPIGTWLLFWPCGESVRCTLEVRRHADGALLRAQRGRSRWRPIRHTSHRQPSRGTSPSSARVRW
jgi:hypothetical protein